MRAALRVGAPSDLYAGFAKVRKRSTEGRFRIYHLTHCDQAWYLRKGNLLSALVAFRQAAGLLRSTRLKQFLHAQLTHIRLTFRALMSGQEAAALVHSSTPIRSLFTCGRARLLKQLHALSLLVGSLLILLLKRFLE